ncbi:hypothetical protein [Hymenobacter sp. BRD67]|uniref:hypothetical protein n=1 Tax=Hymenobacter sp. BRD67 TaxID=2675877 RepID=UPI0015654831|nr:hypothetical protein [Hymenobacter sp. BRD67]QKG55136.1 hypothetical protein GKZ67_22215 [Hymenobacter sp. BRD67]
MQQFYGRAGADETVAAYWKSLPANVFLQATRRGSALLASTVHLLRTGDVIPTRAPHEGPYRIIGTERIFPAAKELGEYLLAQRAALVPAEGAATVIGLDGSLSEIRPAKSRKSFKFEQLRPLSEPRRLIFTASTTGR